MIRNPLYGWIAAAALAAAGSAACSQQSPPAAAPAATAAPAAAPTLEQLKTATVSGVLPQPVALVDGAYSGPPAQPGAASHDTLTLWTPAVVFADVDGSPGNEAVALLSASSGGSGESVHVAVFALKDGKAASVATAPVGDRVRLNRLWVEHGEIHMDVIEAGPKDPACCPTQVARKTYAMEAGSLKQKTSDVVGALSINLAASTDWVLASIDGQPVDQSSRPPTLLVQYGKVVGFGGCNRYAAPLKETEPGRISVGPLAATKMACPAAAMELEDKFTTRMNKVTGYSFLAGQLALTWEDKKERGTLLFSR